MNASEDVIRYLHGIDTPTVSNAIEGLKVRNRASGFCDRTLKCLFPDLGIMCGYAVTAQVETMCLEPPDQREKAIVYLELLRALETCPEPRVVVFQEISPHNEFSAHCGEVMATAFHRLGVICVISDSAVRDLDEVHALGIRYFAPGSVASHANFRVVRVQVPVTVCGLKIAPGDLLHGDVNGLVQVPLEGLDRLSGQIEAVRQAEAQAMQFVKSEDFSLDELESGLLISNFIW